MRMGELLKFVKNELEDAPDTVIQFLRNASMSDMLTITNLVTQKQGNGMSEGYYYDIQDVLDEMGV